MKCALPGKSDEANFRPELDGDGSCVYPSDGGTHSHTTRCPNPE